MKSTVVAKQKGPKSFPKLMVDEDGMLIFFSSHEVGIVVNSGNSSGSNYPVGDFSNSWRMVGLTDFHGTVTLSND